jgi:putative serine/threonine protein kinase
LHRDELIPLEQLDEETHGQVICYPKYDVTELKKRLKELKKLGVTAVEFSGKKIVSDLPVLGKGWVGIVVMAYKKDERVAMKIRRVDADRAKMQHEAEMLKKANTVNIGPNLLDISDNFLIMEFIEGTLLPEWINTLREKGTKSRVQQVLRAVLEQSWSLDELSLDHGELSRAPKHIIIDANEKPWIVDFETASVNRKVSNVTSICQYLFIGSQIAKTIRKRLGKIDRTRLIQALRNYKHKRTRESFEKILRICTLHNV